MQKAVGPGEGEVTLCFYCSGADPGLFMEGVIHGRNRSGSRGNFLVSGPPPASLLQPKTYIKK